MDKKFKNIKQKEIRLNSLKRVYEDLNEVCKLASVVDSYCKHSMNSEEIYNISAVVKIMYSKIEEVASKLNQIIEREGEYEIPEFCKNIDLNNVDIDD